MELGFRIPIALAGFQIPFGEFPGFRTPRVKTFRIPESGLLYMERDSVCFFPINLGFWGPFLESPDN